MHRSTSSSEDQRTSGDRTLVERVLEDDQAAIAELVARLACVPAILASIDERLGAHLSRDELADLAQDTVVRIWSKISTYQGRSRIETWVYGFCLMETMNRVRSKARGTRLLGTRIELEDGLLVAPLPALALEAAEVETELRSLAPAEAAVIRLRHFDELTFREIGAELGLPENSVKTLYYRGLGHLRLRLRRHAHEDRT